MHDDVEKLNTQQVLLEFNLPTLSLRSEVSIVVPAAAASPVCHYFIQASLINACDKRTHSEHYLNRCPTASALPKPAGKTNTHSTLCAMLCAIKVNRLQHTLQHSQTSNYCEHVALNHILYTAKAIDVKTIHVKSRYDGVRATASPQAEKALISQPAFRQHRKRLCPVCNWVCQWYTAQCPNQNLGT